MRFTSIKHLRFQMTCPSVVHRQLVEQWSYLFQHEILSKRWNQFIKKKGTHRHDVNVND